MNDISGMPSPPGYIPVNSQGMDTDPFDFAVTQPLQRVAGAAEDNPDDAARAVDLGKATGVAAPVVAADLDSFEQIHKQSLANQIMRSNPALIDYVRNHPMAASVSNDDWSNLADVSKSSDRLHSLLALDPARGAMEGAYEGFKEGLTTKPAAQQSVDDWYGDKPLAWAVMSAAAFPATELIRGFNAIMGAQFGAIKGGAETAYKAITGDADAAKNFGEEAANDAGVILAGSMAEPWEPSALAGHAVRQREAFQAGRPWFDANLVPPRGVHPAIDEALGDINSEGVQRLGDILKASQTSSTRERSYEMFHDFVDQKHGEATIGIHGPAVAALYGDKVPEPGDGLLGFAPHIGDQLLAANIGGADVHVPIKDWLSQVDPMVATQLQDDIRMFPGAVTAREAQTPLEPKAMLDAPLPQIRGTAGMEPHFALGDRKLALEPDLTMKDPEAFKKEYGAEGFDQAQFDDFTKELRNQDRYNLVDQTGAKAGELHLVPDNINKELYVDHIIAGSGLWSAPNSLGPASVRDVLRQLKDIYPGYTLTGDRVSGARATTEGGISRPRARLNLDKLPEPGKQASPSSLQQVDDTWRQIGSDTWAKASDAIDTIAHQELRRIVGTFPELVPAEKISAGDATTGGRPIYGIFQPRARHPPTIAWNALNPKAVGIARHEGIHYLRAYGFFKPEEWAALEDSALKGDWLGEYGIRDRYSHIDTAAQIEESVAEAYRDWAGGAKPVSDPTGLVAKVFQRMKDLWEAISEKIRDFFGKDVDPEQLFQAVHEGRIARRGPVAEPNIPGVMMPKFSFSDEDFQNLKANSLGLDAKSYGRLRDAIKARHESDLVAAVKRAEAQQAQTQTAEWKANLRSMRGEVERTIRQRPDVAADLFVNSGEYEGQKLRQRIPLRADDLTPEQKATLPENYYAKSGLPVSDVARLFGYQDGQHLIERLSVMAAQRGDHTPQAHLKSLVDGETQLRMERQYGRLEDNIMEAASDQALSDTDINLLTEEYHAAGVMSGQATIDKNVIKAEVQDAFSKIPISAVSSQRLLAEMARHDRDAQRSLIPGQEDEVAALKSMEQKVRTGMMAAEARKLEKQVQQFDKTARKLSKREVPNLPAPYTNFIHQILSQIDKPIRRSADDLKTEISAHDAPHTLKGFIDDLISQLQPTEVWNQLFDQNWHKPYKQLTVEEFRNVKDSVDNLNHIGKEVKKVTNGSAKADLNDIREVLIDGLRVFGVKHYDHEGRWMGPLPPGLAALPRTALAKSLQLETIFGRFDRGDPFGPWTQYGLRPLIESNSEENLVKRDISKKLREIYKSEDDAKLGEGVFNPIWRDTIGGTLLPMDRSNLRAVMLNTGSRGGRLSNLTYLSKGHGIPEETILDWVNQNAMKEDWVWCQKIWDLFREELWEPAQQMRRSLSGVGAKSLDVPPIQTPFGEQRGGYYPVIFKDIKQSAKSLTEGLEGDGYIRATTWDGYAHERTGAYAPLELRLDPMTNRIGQIIHDITMRPAVLNAAKLFYDGDIRTAIKRYYGEEYRDLLIPYLRDVANVSNTKDGGANDALAQLTRAMQKNVATSLIGLNPGTVMKHAPTAAVLSMKEVGPLRFLREVRSLFSTNEETGQSNWAFAKENFEEIQNRDRNWMETLTGTTGDLVPGQSLGNLRQKIAQWGAKPVALSDMLSAVPTSLAAYHKAIEEGLTVGDAKFLANQAVRRAHGSSAITNQSAFQRQLPAALTYYYTFFNTMLNRQAENVWKAADALGATKQFTWDEAKKALAPVSAGIFATVLFPAIIEQLVSPITFKQDDSQVKKAGLIITRDLSSSWLIARDFANYLIEGRDPSLGLYSTAFHEFGDVFKDIHKDFSKQHMSKEDAGHLIKDSAGFLGILSGAPMAVGKAGQFVYGTHVGTEHPQGPWGFASGLRYGTLKGHSPTLERWSKGR